METQTLDEIIQNSTFTVDDGIYVYAKVGKMPEGDHFMVTKDDDEITVVTKVDNIPTLGLIERNKDNYCLIALNVSVPFYCVGFIAKISDAIAKAGMNILVVSTYSKDYILVVADKIDSACRVLTSLGLKKNDTLMEKVKKEMTDILIECARGKGTIAYSQLSERIKTMRIEPDSKLMADLLGEISMSQNKLGQGMLSVLVVMKGEQKPGKGFFPLAVQLGRPEDEIECFLLELKKVHDYWEQH